MLAASDEVPRLDELSRRLRRRLADDGPQERLGSSARDARCRCNPSRHARSQTPNRWRSRLSASYAAHSRIQLRRPLIRRSDTSRGASEGQRDAAVPS